MNNNHGEELLLESSPLLQPRMEVRNFIQHDDPDVVIPDNISQILVYSAHLFAVVAVLSYVYGQLTLGILSTLLYITSVWHWHKPRFSSIARRADYCAVVSVLVYGSYVAFNFDNEYTVIWFAGIGLIATIFITNEYCYYVQVMKGVTGTSTFDNYDLEGHIVVDTMLTKTDDPSKQHNSIWIAPTYPNTYERDYVYWRTVITHTIGVHIFGFLLACVIIVVSYYGSDS